MKNNRIILMIFAIFGFLGIVQCGNKTGCPTCNNQVSWDSYGEFKFRMSGYDGTLYSTYKYPVVVNLPSDCGWKIYKNHNGGYGNLYEVHPANNTGVIFIWSWETFGAVLLSNGWTGSTKEGIRIGDSLSKFLKIYGYFKPYHYDQSRDSIYFDREHVLNRDNQIEHYGSKPGGNSFYNYYYGAEIKSQDASTEVKGIVRAWFVDGKLYKLYIQKNY